MTLLDLDPAQPTMPEPPPPDPDWDRIADRLADVGELDRRWLDALDRRWLDAMEALRVDAVRTVPLSVADLDRARAAAALTCAVDTAALWQWGRWAARRLAEAEAARRDLLDALDAADLERAALTARAVQAEALAVAAGAAYPNPDGTGLLPVARHAAVGEVAA